jgi:hypothetical protein
MREDRRRPDDDTDADAAPITHPGGADDRPPGRGPSPDFRDDFRPAEFDDAPPSGTFRIPRI